jgi:predicted CopG family antitoxin
MSRQLRISDDVHEMLSLLKPCDSISYDEVIRDLIHDVCPSLFGALQDLKLLEQKNPREAAGERLLLQQEIFEDVFVPRIDRQREREEARAEEMYYDSLRTEEQKEEWKKAKEQYEMMRHYHRQKMLFENESTKKNE